MSDEWKDIKGLSIGLVPQLADHLAALSAEHIHKVVQDAEVEGRGEQLAARVPLTAWERRKDGVIFTNNAGTKTLSHHGQF